LVSESKKPTCIQERLFKANGEAAVAAGSVQRWRKRVKEGEPE